MSADPGNDGRPSGGWRTGMRRWFAILLPFAVGLRVLLLVFQLHSEHQPAPQQAATLPAWPPSPGETLRFDAGNRAIVDQTAGPRHDPLPAALLRSDHVAMPPDTGCLLDPAAMARHGGSLSLVSRDAAGYWLADWSGSSTVSLMDEADVDDPPAARRMEMAVLDAEDCGSDARLQLSTPVLHVLVNELAGLPPPPGPPGPSRELNIRVEQPAP